MAADDHHSHDHDHGSELSEMQVRVRALETRDGETAGRLLSAHVQRTGTALWEVLAKTKLSRPAA